jgi:hypothetical protein
LPSARRAGPPFGTTMPAIIILVLLTALVLFDSGEGKGDAR